MVKPESLALPFEALSLFHKAPLLHFVVKYGHGLLYFHLCLWLSLATQWAKLPNLVFL